MGQVRIIKVFSTCIIDVAKRNFWAVKTVYSGYCEQFWHCLKITFFNKKLADLVHHFEVQYESVDETLDGE